MPLCVYVCAPTNVETYHRIRFTADRGERVTNFLYLHQFGETYYEMLCQEECVVMWCEGEGESRCWL